MHGFANLALVGTWPLLCVRCGKNAQHTHPISHTKEFIGIVVTCCCYHQTATKKYTRARILGTGFSG